MKQCQFCAEEIKSNAALCLHCNNIQLDKDELVTKCEYYYSSITILEFGAIAIIINSYLDFLPDFHESKEKFYAAIFWGIIGIWLLAEAQGFKKKSVPILVDKVKKLRRQQYWTLISVVGIFFLILNLMIKVPSPSDFKQYLKTNTEFIEANIFLEKEKGLFSFHIISDTKNRKLCYVGIWNSFYLLDKNMHESDIEHFVGF